MAAAASKPVPTGTAVAHQLGLLLSSIAELGRDAEIFGEVRLATGANGGERLVCAAAAAAEPAEYRVDEQDGVLCVSLVTGDRYLSQSIEQDLVHSGDKIADLLKDELIDVEYDGPGLVVEHFRDPEKLFTFRSKLPIAKQDWGQKQLPQTVWKVLRAYEACFAPLGDMSAGEED